MSLCEEVQRRLAEDGPVAARAEPELLQHLEGCIDCTAVMESIARLDVALWTLPEHDASDELVAKTLRAVEETPLKAGRGTGGVRRWHLAGALAATLVIAAVFGLSQDVLRNYNSWIDFSDAQFELVREAEKAPLTNQERNEFRKELGQLQRQNQGLSMRGDTPKSKSPTDNFGLERGSKADHESVPAIRHAGKVSKKSKDKSESGFAGGYASSFDRRARGADTLDRESQLVARLQQMGTLDDLRGAGNRVAGDDDGRTATPSGQSAASLSRDRNQPARNIHRVQPKESTASSTETDLAFKQGQVTGKAETSKPLSSIVADEKKRNKGAASVGGKRLGETAEASDQRRLRDVLSESVTGPARSPQPRSEERAAREYYDNAAGWHRNPLLANDEGRARARARAYLQRIATLEGLQFQPATGYWSNSYIPGDPAMRLIRSRLSDWDRRQFGQSSRLDQAVQQVAQPFDAPRDAALALYLDADAPSIQGPTRLRLQVGLKGAERQGGHRPAMNVGLVVDARNLDDAALAARVRALIAALVRARQAGDRFSLTIAGPGGGVVVTPEDFRHGPLRVATARLFGTAGASTKRAAVDLVEAVALAAESVRQGDREDAVLGTSLVLLATGAGLAGEVDTLERAAHENAVGGIPLSVVALGPDVDADHVDRLVAAGQGNRRNLLAPDGAEALVAAELHTASRVVARAVRLRIRLSAGVKLVEVLGSRRLDAPMANRVRQAEQAIDRRLARNLGIAADRGRDEEGIQIVIPNFYAGDSHVILLDVVAERPGAIADVTARYKDVVNLKNGVAHARLTLTGNETPAGPLQRNVLKNLLAFELARQTRNFGHDLDSHLDAATVLQMAALRDLVHGLRLEVPGWTADPALAADQGMLEGYLLALRSPQAAQPRQQRLLADSLRNVGFSKLHAKRN